MVAGVGVVLLGVFTTLRERAVKAYIEPQMITSFHMKPPPAHTPVRAHSRSWWP